MRIKPIGNIDSGPKPETHTAGRHIEVEQSPEDPMKLLVRTAMQTEDPNRRIDLQAYSAADNVHRLRGHLLEAHANDPENPAVTIHRREAEELEMKAVATIDALLAEQEQQQEPQLH